jgi:hypothetical protein
MTESDGKCPRCGKHQWWQVYKYVSKSGKRFYEIAQCSSCEFTHRYGWKVHVGSFKNGKQ